MPKRCRRPEVAVLPPGMRDSNGDGTDSAPFLSDQGALEGHSHRRGAEQAHSQRFGRLALPVRICWPQEVRSGYSPRWSTSTGGRSCTCCLVMPIRISDPKSTTALIGIATSLRPHRCPSWSSTWVT